MLDVLGKVFTSIRTSFLFKTSGWDAHGSQRWKEPIPFVCSSGLRLPEGLPFVSHLVPLPPEDQTSLQVTEVRSGEVECVCASHGGSCFPWERTRPCLLQSPHVDVSPEMMLFQKLPPAET